LRQHEYDFRRLDPRDGFDELRPRFQNVTVFQRPARFGDDGRTLYITANDKILRVKTKVKGLGF